MDGAARTAFQERLEAMRRDLVAQEAATADRRAAVILDQTSVGRLSRMDAMQGQQMAAAQSRRRRSELARVDAALARLTAGTFGECAKCGEDVGLKRLDADPATPFCRTCMAR